MNYKKNKVCIIGQGFVGLPMAIAVANSKNTKGKIFYNVLGIEKNNSRGKFLKEQINEGNLPINCSDKKIYSMFNNTKNNNNYSISTDISQITESKIVIVSINFEINHKKKDPFYMLRNFFKEIGKIISKNTLLIIETTLPPGTCDQIIYPTLVDLFSKRGFSKNDIMLSYSYERIMPGYHYYDSVVNNNRVYSGINEKSRAACKYFLSKVINTKKFPLSLLNSNTECEFSKILENSYRATNIALIDEWTKYSRIAKIDIYNVLDAIKKRDTHNNIMRPGLGVGGYCLTKDPLFALASTKIIFKNKNNFPFIKLTMETNQNMPSTSINYIKEKIKLTKKTKILILGLSYREGVGDYRSSPSLVLYKKLKKYGAVIHANDPLVDINSINELKKNIIKQKEKISYYDAVILCTQHKEYKNFNLKMVRKKTVFIDLNNTIPNKIKKLFEKNKIKLFTLGKN